MKKRIINFITMMSLALLVVITSCFLTSCGDEEIDLNDLSVREYVGKNGVVTAANPYAAKVGLDILKQGGNAFDAAVATSFAISVCEMDASGLGGGGLMMSYNVNTKKTLYYNFREFAPSDVSVNLDDYKDSSKYTIYTAVPTFLAGLNNVLENEGTMSLSDILSPSIELAKNGTIITPELAKVISDNDSKLQRSEYLKKVFRKNGVGRLKVGDVIVQNELASTFEKIKENGIDYFYKGELAQKIVDVVNNNGGVMSLSDLELARNRNYLMDDALIKSTYKDYEFITTGSPSTGGTMLALMLNMLESYGDVKSLGHNSVEYVNLLATVMQLAYGDKEKYLADKNFVQIPLDGLLSKEYANERMLKYTPGKAYQGAATQNELPYGDPYKYSSLQKEEYKEADSESHFSTTTFSVADKDGNMVTITQTINNFFGTGVSPEGTGFFLNDEMRDFSFVEGSINKIEPLKQPASYMAPTVVLKNGKPYATFGSPGGSRIPACLLQIFLNLTEFEMSMQDAINSYRVYCYTTNDKTELGQKKVLYIENGLSKLKSDLEKYGYSVEPTGEKDIDSYFGGVQGIKLEGKKLHAGADPRRDGKALGF